MSKKKRDANLANGGLSPIRKKLLSAQHRANEVIEAQFPKLAFTLDANTELMMDALRRPTHLSRGAIARLMIKEVMDSPERFPIEEFYENTWRTVYFRSDQLKRAVQILLPREFSVYLRKTSEKILGTENRSEMFRILAALYATEKGIVRRKRTEVIELEVHDPGGRSKPHD